MYSCVLSLSWYLAVLTISAGEGTPLRPYVPFFLVEIFSKTQQNAFHSEYELRWCGISLTHALLRPAKPQPVFSLACCYSSELSAQLMDTLNAARKKCRSSEHACLLQDITFSRFEIVTRCWDLSVACQHGHTLLWMRVKQYLIGQQSALLDDMAQCSQMLS